MSINHIELQGQITRAQDYTTIKQNEDNKGMLDQTNFQSQFNKEIDQKMNQVHHAENAENTKKNYDAKEKGDGQYSGDGGKKRKKENEKKDDDGKVLLKNKSSFDMKI